ncbi:hypothetical protein [Vibrio phage vB_VmeM-Yong XC32]|nr:hypothetical protein [Vibrio phage vB_VmeM-Yong XC31]QAX96343.1 hypothetical protein [Vibrio phage vB_VmeM-Yong XC32]QAX96661.1 hypothetical protein [Vibrio phage vB_VmeM-Yong MS31]QAX96979.1 hypothetical protein [Vibrio phage vB_VmeM-Yong MS32]
MFDAIAVYEGVLKIGDLETLVNLEKIFEEINYTDHQLEVSEPENLNNLDALEKGLTMMAAYEKHLDLLLMLMGVHLADAPDYINLSVKVEILSTLLATEDLNNLDVVTEALSNSEAEEDLTLLIDVLSAISEKPEVWYEWRIEEVDAKLIQRMKSMLNNAELFEDTLALRDNTKVELANFLDGTGGVIYDKVVEVSQLPISWAVAYTTFAKAASTLTANDVAKEAIAACIASAIPKSELVETARELINDAAGDAPTYPSIMMAFDHLVGAFTDGD